MSRLPGAADAPPSTTPASVLPGQIERPSAQAINALLPQTQCTRCGEPDCAAYAQAITEGTPINRCPPGGAEGIRRLAALTGRPFLPLDTAHGREGPRMLAWIDEAACIGCTLCLKACPVDCIVGASKRMHTVIEADCTGCELCLPACPVDCIHLEEATPGHSGWQAWTTAQADQARTRYQERQLRLAREAFAETDRLASRAADAVPTADVIAAAIARARSRSGG